MRTATSITDDDDGCPGAFAEAGTRRRRDRVQRSIDGPVTREAVDPLAGGGAGQRSCANPVAAGKPGDTSTAVPFAFGFTNVLISM